MGGCVLTKRKSLLIAAGLAAGFLLGCQNDEITHYQVPKEETITRRMLAGILSHGERSWFLKLVGPGPVVDRHKDEFSHLLQSLHVTDAEQPLHWDAPAGWTATEPNRAFGQLAAYKITDGEQVAMVTISRAGGTVLANVNRWRGQMGLAPVTEAELPEATREVKANGLTITVVALEASSTDALPERPMAAPPPQAQATAVTFDKPAGWQEVPANRAMGVQNKFQIGEGEQRAEASIAQAGGSLLLNVNRWRGQVGLGSIDEAQLQKDLKHLDVDGQPADYIDLSGPGPDGHRPLRMLAVVVRRGAQVWFFKLMGPTDRVTKEQPAFESFVKSAKFAAAAGANHE
jgi:hypothetical protein